MSKILNKIFYVLNFLLIVSAFLFTFYGINKTYNRLDKSLVESIPVFAPFVILFVFYVINLIFKQKKVTGNLLYNFAGTVCFLAILYICYRAAFDKNMVLWHKYGIKYNTQFLADNLSSIKAMLYCLIIANFFLILSGIGDKKKKKISFQESSVN